MDSLHTFMPAALADLLRRAPLTPEKIAFAWRSAVGAKVADASAIELRGTVLNVQVKDAAWQREVERSAGLIRSRLEALLGAGVVKGLAVTVDPSLLQPGSE